MGFADKVKGAMKSADEKLGNAIDCEKLDSEIRKKEKEIKDATEEIGKKVVEALKAGDAIPEGAIKEIYAKIEEAEAKIAELEAEKESIKGKKEE